MDTQVNDQVLAEVLLRTNSGYALADPTQAVTAANVTQYYSSESIVQTAVQRFTALGFDVVHQDPLGLTIEGNKTLFERVFHTHLARQPGPRSRPPRPSGVGSTPPAVPEADAAGSPGDQVDALTSGWANSWEPAPPPHTLPPSIPPPSDGAQADRDPAPAGGWVATQPMTVPASLRDVVDQVVLPTPATYHGC